MDVDVIREFIISHDDVRNAEHNQPMEDEPNHPLTLYVRLLPSVEGTTNRKDVCTILSKYPETGLDLKTFLQDQFQIPKCLMRITFQSNDITDEQQLKQLHLRDEDVINLHYTTTGDLSEIHKVKETMVTIIQTLEVVMSEFKKDRISPLVYEHLEKVVGLEVEDLVNVHFKPSNSEPTKTNRLYFITNGGVFLAVHLHSLLVRIKWEKMTIKLQLLEHSVLRLIWDLSSTLGVRCLLYEFPDLIDQISKSMLRLTIEPYKPIKFDKWFVNEVRYISPTSYNELLGETMFKAIGVITNLADLPKYRVPIASTPGLIQQITSALLCPSFNFVCSQLVASTFLCLSYTVETHQYFLTSAILNGILDACKKCFNFNPFNSSISQATFIIINYFFTVFFAQICTNIPYDSLCLLGNDLIKQITDIMYVFIQKETPETIHQSEIKTCYFSSTIKPLVRLCYFHYDIKTKINEEPLLKELYFLSVRAGLLSLQNICLSDEFPDIVEKEELIDYIVCLPHVMTDEELKSEADKLVRLASMKVKIRPPLLINIVKSHLAIYQFNLDEVTSPFFIDYIYKQLEHHF